ncbi:MAG: DHH family phosphoesterase [Mollicutes bacterium]|nr:MAG: DHH family phosphoesterase [Mollicutes bacterium]
MLRKIYPHKKIFTPYDNRRVKFLNFLKTDKTSINENTNFQNALLILVDCNKLERTDYPEIKNKKTVVIDHHEIDQKLKTNLN